VAVIVAFWPSIAGYCLTRLMMSVFAMACSAVPLLCAGSLTDCSTALKTATSMLRARLLTG
jgi:hypothetical protein